MENVQVKLNQWTIFLDVLGFGDLNNSINSDSSADALIKFMADAEKIITSTSFLARDEKIGYQGLSFDDFYDISICFISDSIIISYKPKEVKIPLKKRMIVEHNASAFLGIIGSITSIVGFYLMAKGVLLRGGISKKYSKIQGHFAVGPGVIEAHYIESKIARFPRVALHSSITEDQLFLQALKDMSDKISMSVPIIKKDLTDGVYYLNLLGFLVASKDLRSYPVRLAVEFGGVSVERLLGVRNKFFEIHKDIVIKKIQDLAADGITKGNVFEKLEWLKKHHNDALGDWLRAPDFKIPDLFGK